MSRTIRIVITIFCILIFLVGFGLFIWPTISAHLQQEIVNDGLVRWKSLYSELRAQLPGEQFPSTEEGADEVTVLPELYYAMKAYNEEIYINGQINFNSREAYAATVIDVTQYGVEPDPETTGPIPIGNISIPKIHIQMPLYLGASDENLAKGFAHMGQTSLPIGGENTNCVVAAHRGWGNAAYMRDVHLVELGDSVFVETFWGTMEYRVCEIKIIDPDEIHELLIQPGRDLLTIFTCTPYGVGTQRHVLYCERYIQ